MVKNPPADAEQLLSLRSAVPKALVPSARAPQQARPPQRSPRSTAGEAATERSPRSTAGEAATARSPGSTAGEPATVRSPRIPAKGSPTHHSGRTLRQSGEDPVPPKRSKQRCFQIQGPRHLFLFLQGSQHCAAYLLILKTESHVPLLFLWYKGKFAIITLTVKGKILN